MKGQDSVVISQGDQSFRREGSHHPNKQDAIHDDFFWPYGGSRKRDCDLKCPTPRLTDTKRLYEPIIGQSHRARPVCSCLAFGQGRACSLGQGSGGYNHGGCGHLHSVWTGIFLAFATKGKALPKADQGK
jgi:hypothetical protein